MIALATLTVGGLIGLMAAVALTYLLALSLTMDHRHTVRDSWLPALLGYVAFWSVIGIAFGLIWICANLLNQPL